MVFAFNLLEQPSGTAPKTSGQYWILTMNSLHSGDPELVSIGLDVELFGDLTPNFPTAGRSLDDGWDQSVFTYLEQQRQQSSPAQGS